MDNNNIIVYDTTTTGNIW